MQFRSVNLIWPRLSLHVCKDIALLSGFLVGAFSAIWLPERWEPKCFFGFVLIAMSISAWKQSIGSGERSESEPKDGMTQATAERSLSFRAWTSIGGFTFVAVGVLLVVCIWTGVFRLGELVHIFDRSAGSWLQTKLPTIIGQQVLLHLLLLPVLLRLCKRVIVAVLLGALIFSMLHLPNPILVLLTFVAGTVWLGSYIQTRRLTPVVLSHCILAMMVAGVCGEYVLNLRVGPKCAEIFPRKIESESGPMYEFPGCTVGVAERLVQRDDILTLKGWVYDCVHHRSPSSLYLNIEGRLQRIPQVEFVRTPASDWKNADQSGFVDDTCYSFTATIPAAMIQSEFDRLIDNGVSVDEIQDVELFAANVNGSLTQIPCQGSIRPIENLKTRQAIVLFPVEIDGRINFVESRQGSVHLNGWAAGLQSHEIPKRLLLDVDGREFEIEMQSHRSRRPGIARALNDPKLIECGFDFPIEHIDASSTTQIRCFAIDDEGQLHPIRLTDQARARMAKQASPKFR